MVIKSTTLSLLFLATSIASTADAGYCNWGPEGTGASSTCDGDVQGGDLCNASSENCEEDCRGRWCTNNSVTGSTSNATSTATTTRYWDCSGGACGCAYQPFGVPSKPAHCYSNAMFAAPVGNEFGATFYGSAAISEALGGGGWLAEGCGKCWKVTGTSNVGNSQGVSTTLVLKGTNFCPPANAACSNGKAHFDIAAPGFDVLAYSLSNTCLEREPNEKEGFASCEFWPGTTCDCSKFKSSVLKGGCDNFLSLQWDNPTVEYEEVDCPQELAQLPCWEENGNQYPPGTSVPGLCADPNFNSAGSSTTNRVPTPFPTVAPISAAPVPNFDNFCCSHDLQTCASDDFCNSSRSNCEDDCQGVYLDPSAATCNVPLWGECTTNTSGCCGSAQCVEKNQWYKQCLLV